jgi:hypothetical protein
LDLREQLDSLQAELSSRSSIVHFAHTGVAMIAALIVAGAAGKLSWDTPKYPQVGLGIGMLALGLCAYAVIHYRRGQRVLRYELERFELLKSLRRALHLDDPSALLPQ